MQNMYKSPKIPSLSSSFCFSSLSCFCSHFFLSFLHYVYNICHARCLRFFNRLHHLRYFCRHRFLHYLHFASFFSSFSRFFYARYGLSRYGFICMRLACYALFMLCMLAPRAQAIAFLPDSYTASTLHALGVGTEFLPSIQASPLLQATDTRWSDLVKQFDASYEFIPIIRAMIIQADIPQEFLFLAMAESGFSSRAYSKKRAVGIWQFMPYTAKDLGLVINDYVDERRDPIKSTQAAIHYLRFLYNATGEWYLAAMAYNCGLARLNKAIARAGSKELAVLLDDKEKYLPRETRHYIRMILKLSLAFNNATNMQAINREYLLNRGAFDTLASVQVKGGVPLASLAKSANMSVSELKQYNRHFTYSILPKAHKTYSIYIPYDKLAYFRQHYDPSASMNAHFVLHRVKKGESLSSIAKKYGISVRELAFSNNMPSKHTIYANQRIIIPILQKLAHK